MCTSHTHESVVRGGRGGRGGRVKRWRGVGGWRGGRGGEVREVGGVGGVDLGSAQRLVQQSDGASITATNRSVK